MNPTLLLSSEPAYRSGPVGWLGLAMSLALIVVAMVLSRWRGLGLGRDMAVAAVRAAVQLLVVGLALDLVLRPSAPLVWAWLWVVLMIGVAAATVVSRVREVPGVGLLALVALGASAVVGLGVMFGLRVFPLQGRTIVPLAGMLVGNAMTATVVSVRRLVAEFADKRDDVEARLALGLTWQEASRPHVRAALKVGLMAQIEATKAVGLVALPGAMTGLILAGVRPLDAVMVQAAVMYLVLGAVATSVTVVGVGLTRKLFTADHRLVYLARH